jgi:predicted phosphodiesterase
MLNINGKQIDFVGKEGSVRIRKKGPNKIYKVKKPNKADLTLTNICVISDTHIGTKEQQLTLLNEVYREAARRNITTILHCGDLLDGDYIKIRPEQQYQLFLKGFDEQVEYVIDMYPKVNGIKTLFIQGSHDETHLKNGGATPGKWITTSRSDMEYMGQDDYTLTMNKVKIKMEHPGGGVAKSLSYKTQGAIEQMTPGNKPNVLLQGHYHKCYYMFYRNVHAFLVPCLVNQSQFMKKQNIANIVGAYFLKIYSDEKGNVHYILPEDYLFTSDQIKENDYMHCKRLVM